MKGKNFSPLRIVIVVLVGMIVGSFLSDYFSTWFKPLGIYKTIGMASPVTFDLYIFKISFQLMIKSNIGTVVGLIAALLVNNKF